MQSNIRNFAIIAHIDHGKSTLSDRFIQLCGSLQKREMQEQVLDSMDLERERGITIKAQSVTLDYQARDGQMYQLNLIDTPGHVDFSYEVSRSLAACDGALIVVDASQGVEAQTMAVCYMAVEQDLEMVIALNKIDLPQAEPERVMAEIEDMIGIEATDALPVSAKKGEGVEDVLERIIQDVPAPSGDPNAPLRALIIDSWYDTYLGVVSLVRIVDGKLTRHDKIVMLSNDMQHFKVEKLGRFNPKMIAHDELHVGELGFVVAGIKDINAAPVGDTITHAKNGSNERLPGFKRVKPQVYAGVFPTSSEDYEAFRDALEKLSLNDASLFFEPETSAALGFGFRCGFLGMLHMEIIQERLEREYQLELITTAPTVVHEVHTRQGDVQYIDNPAKLPDQQDIMSIREPIAEANILVPEQYLGSVIKLCEERRGVQRNMQYTSTQISLTYELPMSEIVLDFFDRIQSISRGFASLDYSFKRYQEDDLVKLDVLVNGDRVDALSLIVHRRQAHQRGRRFVEKMKELIPRQMFEVAIQAAIGNDVVARATVKALRKNVLSKCYGGDVSRKRKLLEKQKEGKKRMKQVGKIDIPQEAFLAVLKVDNDQ